MTFRDDDGFTLIEALAALFIIIAAAAILYRGFSSASRVSSAAEAAETALLVAQARLAALGVETPLQAGEQEGQDGDVSWRTALRPYSGGPHEVAAGLKAFWATVTVQWREKHGRRPRSLKLTTLKLGRAK
jgi:general secretion pathway protein I